MKNLFIFFLSLFLIPCSFAQAPDIEWEKSYGGSTLDDPDYIIPIKNGNYIMTGDGYSIDGDVTGHHGTAASTDIWIVQIDSAQNIVWENSFGGSSNEFGSTIQQTSDGGYIAGGISSSNDGDVAGNHGDYDYWIFKISPSGELLWQKTFGGTQSDEARFILLTPDDGCLVVGQSASADGDITDHHGLPGTSDCWILKLDAFGNIEWKKSYGGSGSENSFSADYTADGNFIISAGSSSTDGDVTGNHGLSDFWIFKINTTGEILWEKSYGGTQSESAFHIHSTSDGGFIICGSAESNNGDLTGHNGVAEKDDIWIVKIDSTGILQWQQNYGGTNYDYGRDAIETSDGSFIFTGFAYSSNGDIDTTHGGSDVWLVKIAPGGSILWQKSLGGTKDDSGSNILELDDKSLLILAQPYSTNGDITASHGNMDYWLVKLYTECLYIPETCNSLDDNCNGLIDDGITETISITAGGPISFCQGGSVLLTATYSGASVQWKKNGTNIPGATGATYNVITKGNYTCVTTSACGTTESTPIFVNVIKNPNASISAGGPTTFCAGGSVILTEVASPGCSYQWYKGANPISGATSLTYSATTSGNYKCRVTKAATGCFKNSNAIAVSVPCREGENITKSNFSLYPNPANNFITIKTDFSTEKTISITDALGQIVKTITTSENNITIDLQGIASGVYFIKMEDGINTVTQKFVKL